jgi:alanyl-tRNA synthetase
LDIPTIKRLHTEHYRRYGFAVLPSSSLVNDKLPTAFVMSVGLLQLEPVLAEGPEAGAWHDFAMVQRCIRHYDMEMVGDANRLSLFEMAGAITAGSKSTDEIVESLLRLIFKEFGFSPNRVFFTVFGGGRFGGIHCPSDDESLAALRKNGIWGDHVISKGVEENFFGIVPREEYCGPSLETFVDRGPLPGNIPHECGPGCSCGRFIEIGNTVFLCYHKEKGRLNSLPQVYGESAFGIERTALAMSSHATIYELPEFSSIKDAIEAEFRLIDDVGNQNLHANICADHLRAIVFAIVDGARPGHGGRRYVLRKLIRRLLVRLGKPKGDLRKSLCKVAHAVATVNTHIVEINDLHIQDIVSVIEKEKVVFETGSADPSHYLVNAPSVSS